MSPLEDKGLQQIAASILTPVELEQCRKQRSDVSCLGRANIQKKLLDELRDSIAGKQASADSLKEAQDIIAAVTMTEQQTIRAG